MNERNQIKGEITTLRVDKYEGDKKPGDKPIESIEFNWPKGQPATRKTFDGQGNLLETVEVSQEEISQVKGMIR
jgi:hypothetical protein